MQVPFNASSAKSKGKNKMIELSLRQTVYVVLTVIGTLAVMIGGLIFWAYDQPSCWDLNSTEQAAILNCEK